MSADPTIMKRDLQKYYLLRLIFIDLLYWGEFLVTSLFEIGGFAKCKS